MLLETALTNRIIGCAYEVSNTLGVGFLEKVYENALTIELKNANLLVEQQVPLDVTYQSTIVGHFVCDLRVNQSVIVELKACSGIDNAHIVQCMNYLKASQHRFGLIINFGKPKVEVKRVVNGY
ncbi:GxxExxY protein [Methylophilus sp. DW102]|uniref:GxxExxY protein n=1 Tax=Methylophilus sp. DW102 TaxID=3095607 RepID=UPI003088E014|nr:GxxExxY protein [Methylophilus sp. DW102]